MPTDDSIPRGGRGERYCILAIYGAPVMLAAVSMSVIMLRELRLGSPWLVRSIDDALLLVNMLLAGMISASGEALRQGTFVRQLASGLLYGVVGVALYFGILLAALMLGYQIVTDFL